MTSILDTILTAVGGSLPSGSESYVSAAARALETREALIAEQIISAAVSAGVNPAEAKQALAQTGITLPSEPEPETPAQDGRIEARVERIEATVRELDRVLSNVLDTAGRLTALAERHLGVSV